MGNGKPAATCDHRKGLLEEMIGINRKNSVGTCRDSGLHKDTEGVNFSASVNFATVDR